MRPTSKQLTAAQANKGKFVAPERKMTHEIIEYLKIAYPRALWKYDYGADANLSGRQAKEQKDMSCVRGWPELHIYERRHGYSGLILELKKEDVSIYNTVGLFKSEHLKEQNEVMELLRNRGYYCAFSKGFDRTRQYLDWYLTPDTFSPIPPFIK